MSNTTNAATYYATNAAAMRPVRQEAGEVIKGFAGLHQAAITDGEVDKLHKELIALAIGLAIRCENCIYSHMQAAMKLGATRAQVMEAAGVAVVMGGGPVYTYLPRVVEALDALEA
jgi:AhpD family alkylhydroperoxidase